MSKLSNYLLTLDTTTDVVAAYAAAPYEPVPVASNAPQVVFGSFQVPSNVTARLLVSGLNSGPAVLTVTLYERGVATACTLTITGTQENVFYSSNFDFKVGSLYQVAAQYLGASGNAVVRTFSLGTPA